LSNFNNMMLLAKKISKDFIAKSTILLSQDLNLEFSVIISNFAFMQNHDISMQFLYSAYGKIYNLTFTKKKKLQLYPSIVHNIYKKFTKYL